MSFVNIRTYKYYLSDLKYYFQNQGFLSLHLGSFESCSKTSCNTIMEENGKVFLLEFV